MYMEEFHGVGGLPPDLMKKMPSIVITEET